MPGKRRHIQTVVAIAAACIAITVIVIAVRPSPDLRVKLEGKVAEQSDWEAAFRNDDLLRDWQAWLTEQQAPKPYFTIWVSGESVQDGALEWSNYRIEMICGDEGADPTTSEFPVKPDDLTDDQPRIVRRSLRLALVAALRRDPDLFAYVTSKGLETPVASDYVSSLVAIGPPASRALPQLLALATNGDAADLQVAAAKAIRLLQAPTDAAYLDTARQLLQAEHPVVRQLALDGMAAHPRAANLAILTAQARDGNEADASYALAQLTLLGPVAAGAIDDLADIVADDKRSVERRRLAALAIAATTSIPAEVIDRLAMVAADDASPDELRVAARAAAFVASLDRSQWSLAITQANPPPPSADEASSSQATVKAKIRFRRQGQLDVYNVASKEKSQGTWASNGTLTLSLPGMPELTTAIGSFNSMGSGADNTKDSAITWQATRD